MTAAARGPCAEHGLLAAHGGSLAALIPILLLLALAAPPALHAQRGAAPLRSIAIDERLAADAGIRLGDTLIVATAPAATGPCITPPASATPNGASSALRLCDTVVVGALVRRSADPSEIARGEYRVRLHLDQLQQLAAIGDRVDRFAVETRGPAATDTALARINDAAFGFRAYRSREIAVETSRTFLVVSRFHRAIGVITVVASAIFLLCIMLLKVDERRRDVAALRLMGISARTIVRSVVLEAALIALAGSLVGVLLGWLSSALVNWHYRGVYRTPLAFSLVTPGIVGFAVALSLVLGVVAGLAAAMRLVRMPPLELLTGRRTSAPAVRPSARTAHQ